MLICVTNVVIDNSDVLDVVSRGLTSHSCEDVSQTDRQSVSAESEVCCVVIGQDQSD